MKNEKDMIEWLKNNYEIQIFAEQWLDRQWRADIKASPSDFRWALGLLCSKIYELYDVDVDEMLIKYLMEFWAKRGFVSYGQKSKSTLPSWWDEAWSI